MKLTAELKNFIRIMAAKVPCDMDHTIQEYTAQVAENDFLTLLSVAMGTKIRIPAPLLKGTKEAFCTGCEDALDNLVSGNATKKDAYDVIRFYRDTVKGLYDSRRISAQAYCDILDIYNQNVDFVKNF